MLKDYAYFPLRVGVEIECVDRVEDPRVPMRIKFSCCEMWREFIELSEEATPCDAAWDVMPHFVSISSPPALCGDDDELKLSELEAICAAHGCHDDCWSADPYEWYWPQQPGDNLVAAWLDTCRHTSTGNCSFLIFAIFKS